MLKITVRQLEIFIAIAKAQNISVAAESVHLSQSALSMALMELEHRLGEKLFDRIGKRLMLNAAGKRLLPDAINIVQQVKTLESSLSATEQELQGELNIGASTTIGNYLLPTLTARFLVKYPRVHIKLKVDNTAHIIQELAKFNIDVGIIEGVCSHPAIEVIPWKKDRLVVVAAPKHPLTKKRRVTLNDLRQASWIMREPGSGTRELFEKAIGGNINSVLELGHTEAIKQAVATGLGISCLSELAVAQAVKNKQLMIIKTPFLKLTRNLYILLHKKKLSSTLLSAFIQSCRENN